jgi:pimeloyl-ACP methyl ester carboxylesterase
LVLLLATAGSATWIVYRATHPLRHTYLVTPEKFTQLSTRGVKAIEGSWSNHDGTTAQGWVLRGGEGLPAIVLLHRYNADRSWYLNLGVKLNEQTNFTVLWPDLRGHGENPKSKTSSLGMFEGDDTQAAIAYLRSLKTPQGRPLVGDKIGLYGAELGAFAALKAASGDQNVRALALDSVPAGTEDILNSAVRTQLGIDNPLMRLLAKLGMQTFMVGRYQNITSCSIAPQIDHRSILLLSGPSAGPLQGSTVALSRCFPRDDDVEVNSDLALTGYNLHPSTGEQEEAYDRLVIDFFDKSLRSAVGGANAFPDW